MVWKTSMHLCSMIFLLFFSVSSFVLGVFFMFNKISFVVEWDILGINSTFIVATYVFDWMSLVFMSFVMFISSMVLFYSGGYMEGDYNMDRFIYLVLAFVLSMVFLIISPNLISILLGWDGLGLVSYALVIYYQNEKSANAGMLTVLSNRVGDVAILLSISLMFSLGGWNFIYYVFYLEDSGCMILKMLVILAAMTKSAQIPFSAWLPAAMAAPTPVSALVHSSTLVTAGVYLLVRFSPAFADSTCLPILLLISSLTMFMSGLGANFEYDLKKVIALSTLSQLGVMLSILSLGFADLAFFHLLTHALFKALLFMCAGVIIHNVKEYQDVRCMGGLIVYMPLTCMCMNLANLALCGMPFLAGFYSKDLILEVAFMNHINMISFFLYVVSTMLTVCYTFRLIYYSMTGSFNLGGFSNVDDSGYIMTTPMLCLSVGAVLGGALLSWSIFPECYMICLSHFMKNLVLLVSVLGGLLGYYLNIMSVNFGLNSQLLYFPTVVSGSMWFLPFMSTYNGSKVALKVSHNYSKILDKGWSEKMGGQGLFKVLGMLSSGYQLTQDNSFKLFLKMTLVGIFIVLF
uniref:NADH-ubiquinone oxidoreductase chain 5 n=1 Tax=Clibanarius infraspinatus TaxID=1566627 RepID=A0A0A1IXJ2_9EUCA|nr:NADH dehydrogenase subunit 5 [Clibanarius infraspinatus]CEH27543.1 NADH dehydrogenase subunit 5 [Clibanarius infraspinatus]